MAKVSELLEALVEGSLNRKRVDRKLAANKEGSAERSKKERLKRSWRAANTKNSSRSKFINPRGAGGGEPGRTND